MHTEQVSFIESVRKRFSSRFYGAMVLDVGSLDINGSNRKFFYECRYLGIDIQPGKGVDLVCPARRYNSGPIFDVVISTECLEHDETWQRTLEVMVKSLVPGGLLILTCATTGRPEHGTIRNMPHASPFTNDYYRNVLPADLDSVRAAMSEHETVINSQVHDLYFWGLKKTNKGE